MKDLIDSFLSEFVQKSRKVIREHWKDLRGSHKDPLIYFSLALLVLFSFTSFFPYSFNQSSKSGFLSHSAALQQNSGFFIQSALEKDSPDLSLIQRNTLMAAAPPIMVTPQVLGAIIGGSDLENSRTAVEEYLVEDGDTLWSIAGQFSISLDTILWANDLTKNSVIQPGQKLVILPVSGVVHHVGVGDTVSEVAQTYKGKTSDIVAFNGLSGEADIFPGDILIVPGGTVPPPVRYAPAFVPLASSYFICPISQPCRITQALHWYNAVDFSHGQCGEPIYSAAAGTVQRVQLTNSASKWAFGGAGNNITILHPNGVVTFYGHLQSSLVKAGQQVSQGQIIAFLGGMPGTPGAGRSTGCHVHLGVRGARNPFAP